MHPHPAFLPKSTIRIGKRGPKSLVMNVGAPGEGRSKVLQEISLIELNQFKGQIIVNIKL